MTAHLFWLRLCVIVRLKEAVPWATLRDNNIQAIETRPPPREQLLSEYFVHLYTSFLSQYLHTNNTAHIVL